MCDGMATMTHRTTFALDKTTAQRLRRLARRWQVSQAEVVRRALEESERTATRDKPDPVAMLRRLHENGEGIEPGRADKWLAQIRQDRKHWRGS